MTQRPVGVILAGGASRRMGRDKAELTLQHQTFVTRLRSVLTPLVTAVWVSRAKATGEPQELVDPPSAVGPLAGWLAAAEKFPGQSMLSVPVDMPGLTPEILEQLMTDTWLRVGEHDHWLVAHLSSTTLSRVQGYLASGEVSARGFLPNSAKPVPVPENPRFRNVNTDEDWQLLKREFSR